MFVRQSLPGEKIVTQYFIHKITDGKFGALMEVKIVNDGPVTVQIESPKTATDSNPNTEMKEAVITERGD